MTSAVVTLIQIDGENAKFVIQNFEINSTNAASTIYLGNVEFRGFSAQLSYGQYSPIIKTSPIWEMGTVKTFNGTNNSNAFTSINGSGVYKSLYLSTSTYYIANNQTVRCGENHIR